MKMGIPVVNSTLRELLPLSSTGTTDESALLSAADLITLLDKIRTRSEGIKEKVHKTVTTYNKEFNRIISQASNTAADVQSVSVELQAVLELLGERVGETYENDLSSSSSKGFLSKESGISNSFTGLKSSQRVEKEKKTPVGGKKEAERSDPVPVDVEICKLAEKVRTLKSRVKEREEALVVVKAISAFSEQLFLIEKKFTPAHLLEAAHDMRTLQKKLGLEARTSEETPHEAVDDVKAFKLLQQAWTERFDKLLGILDELFSRAVLFNETTSEFSVVSSVSCENLEVGADPAAIRLPAIFTAMDVMDVLDARLAKLGDAIYRNVLAPLLKNFHIEVARSESGDGGNFNLKSSIKLLSSPQGNNDRGGESVATLYPKVVEVIKFLHKQVFGDHPEWMARFGRVFWPRLAESIISGSLSKAVPNDTSQLEDFQRIAELTGNFEMEIAREGLIANFDQTRGDKLTAFTSDVEVHFALKKKKNVLAKARDLLTHSDYSLSGSSWESSYLHHQEDNGTEEDRSIFLLQDSCAISVLARKLMEIVHESVEDACLSTPRTALELYHAARDILLLYRAIIPVKLGSKMSSLSQVAALCHNDCLYIAHELLTIAYQYGEVLPPSLKKVFTFADLVPLFRRMAVEVLDRQVTFVDTEITETLDHARGFQRTDDQEQYEITQRSMQRVFDIFENLAALWKPVLSFTLYKRMIGGLIGSTVSRIVFEILAIDDIAVQETVQLRELLLFVQETIPSFLAPPAAEASKGDQAGDENYSEESVEKLVPSWRKLESLLNLLDMSLVSITQAWDSGDLRSRGFTAAEVQKFIRATFSETALREECLQRII